MKTILILLVLLLSGATLCAQTAKKATPSKSKSTQQPVKISYDENFRLYYIADSVTGKMIKGLPAYKKVYQFTEGMAAVETDKGAGYINTLGKEIVPPNGKYNLVYAFKGGLACVGNEKDGKKTIGYINKTGVLVIPLSFQEARSFREKLAAVKKNGKWGFINPAGAFVIPAMYEYAGNFSFGLAAVSIKKTSGNESSVKYGYINKAGKQVLPFIYEEAGEFKNTAPDFYEAIVTKGFVPMLISKEGKDITYFPDIDDDAIIAELQWVDESGSKLYVGIKESYHSTSYGVYSSFAAAFAAKPQYTEIELVEEPNTGREFFFVKKYKSLGLVRGYGDEIPAVYDHIQFNDTLVYAIDNIKVENDQVVGGAFTLYDLNLNRITKKEYDQITGFFDGLAKVKSGGKTGFINKKGVEVIPLEYDDAGNFSSGMVPVLKNGKVGAINTKGEVVIPFEYENIGSFSDGYAYYQKNGKKGIINLNGNKITEAVFEDLGNFSFGLAQFVKDKKVGFLNTKGEKIVDAKYDVALPFADSLALVSVDKKVGFIDVSGKLVIPIKYDDASDFRNGFALVQENEKKFLINRKGEIVKTYD